MTNYDLLVAVVRDRGGAANFSASIFMMGAFMMFLVAVLILLSRRARANNKVGGPDDGPELVNQEIINPRLNDSVEHSNS